MRADSGLSGYALSSHNDLISGGEIESNRILENSYTCSVCKKKLTTVGFEPGILQSPRFEDKLVNLKKNLSLCIPSVST